MSFSSVDIENGTLHIGHCIEVLESLPPESVQTCITSPPYWQVKDYNIKDGVEWDDWEGVLSYEPTVWQYIKNLTAVFKSVFRVLRHDGTLWLNMGDTYLKRTEQGLIGGLTDSGHNVRGNLAMLPWSLAIYMASELWCLRRDVIWHRPNAIPESVTNRPVKDFEYLFMFTKSRKGYYYDWEGVREPQAPSSIERQKRGYKKRQEYLGDKRKAPRSMKAYYDQRKNDPSYYRRRRSVWSIPVSGLNNDSSHIRHHAAFPEALVEICVKASSREGDVVLDPFLGSGTTAIVSEKLNRKWIGIDVNPEYCVLSAERIRKAAGEKGAQ